MTELVSKRPLVSFIVASYNYARYVGTTLASILSQTISDFEVIVIDDASTDNSLDVIQSFHDSRIRLIANETNSGIVATYNKGLSLARGEYITFVDADDWIEPSKIEQQLAFFRENPQIAIVGTYVKAYDADGGRQPNPDFEEYWNRQHDFNLTETWIGQNRLNACSPLIARRVFDEIGYRDATLAIVSDYEFWVRAHARGFTFGMIDRPLICYRIHDKNVSMSDPRTVFLELCYVMQKTILPSIEDRYAMHLLTRAIRWVIEHPQFGLLRHEQAHRLLAILRGKPSVDCLQFKRAVLSADE